MIHTKVVIFSYKGSNLIEVIDDLFASASRDIYVIVYDQSPLNRKEKLKHINNLHYTHIFWDEILSPASYKAGAISNADVYAPYTLVMSDDIMLSDGWDSTLIRHVDKNNVVVSGFNSAKLKIHDKYFLRQPTSPSEDFVITNCIDANLIFGKTETIISLDYPTDIKYLGESEKLSMNAFGRDVPIACAPSSLLKKDFCDRTMENLYSPFSIEHNYNSCIDMMVSEKHADWLNFHGVDKDSLRKIPYQIDDVPYNPYQLKFNDVEQDRFIGTVKAIY
jgi:hypothetical protein